MSGQKLSGLRLSVHSEAALSELWDLVRGCLVCAGMSGLSLNVWSQAVTARSDLGCLISGFSI